MSQKIYETFQYLKIFHNKSNKDYVISSFSINVTKDRLSTGLSGFIFSIRLTELPNPSPYPFTFPLKLEDWSLIL